jgi:hypothetical protein
MKFERETIAKQLSEGLCKVVFEKKNGDLREMICTLKEDMLPTSLGGSAEKKKSNLEVMAVWDTLKADWRSFRLDSVKEFTACQ